MKNIKKILAVALAALVVLSVFAACSFSPEKKLLGAWRDSTGTMGYEFLEEGKCKVTYADVTVPVLGFRYNGTVDGVYSVSKRDDGNYSVNVTYTILTKSITKDYMFVVEDSSLTLTDTADGTVTTLIAYTVEADTTETVPAQ